MYITCLISMTIRPLAFAFAGLAAFGLAACDAADSPAAPETATGAFDAALFPDAGELIVISNRSDAPDRDRAIRYRNPDAFARKTAFFRQKQTGVTSFQTAKFDEVENDFFGTFDLETGGRVARYSRQGELLATSDDLVSPKGFDIASFGVGAGSERFLVVADVGQAGIFIYDAATLASLLTLSEPDGVRAWDVHYFEPSAAVFAANTDGTVSVYSFFSGFDPIGRFQVLGADGQPAVNLHGITFDPESNTLAVSDVGLAGNPDDGAIHILDLSAFTGDGSPLQARATITGPNTRLGNPVDIAGSGADLFVAEKANGGGRVLRFANVLAASGVLDVAPAAADALPNPESVDVIVRRRAPSIEAPTLAGCRATPSRVNVGEQVTLNATVSGGEPVGVFVDFGTWSGTMSLPAQTTYSSPGTYTVTVTATNSAGSDTCTVTVTVGDD